MPNTLPPFDPQGFLRRQRALLEAQLALIDETEAGLDAPVRPPAAGTEERHAVAAESRSTSGTSGKLYYLVLVALLVCAGVFVIKPPPNYSEEVLRLRSDIKAEQGRHEKGLKELADSLISNRQELLNTQAALQAANEELKRTQDALRATQQQK